MFLDNEFGVCHCQYLFQKKLGEPLKDPEVIENIAKIYEKEGSDCWFSDNPQKFLGKKYNKDDFIKSNDIVEVWFDSGSTHAFVLEKRKDLKWPASMYLEGSDQHRGWFPLIFVRIMWHQRKSSL